MTNAAAPFGATQFIAEQANTLPSDADPVTLSQKLARLVRADRLTSTAPRFTSTQHSEYQYCCEEYGLEEPPSMGQLIFRCNALGMTVNELYDMP